MNQNIREILGIVLGIVLLLVMVGGTLYIFGNIMETTKQDQQDSITPYCSYECHKYDMQFHELVNDGWMWDCWCMADKPHFTKRYDGNDYNN